MASKTINDLRDTLFDTLDRLRDRANPLELDRAQAIVDVAGKIIDTARVEVQYSKVTEQLTDGRFFDQAPEKAKRLERGRE